MKQFSKSASVALITLALAASINTPAHALEHVPPKYTVVLEQNAPAFAEASVRAIAGTWNPNEMMMRAAPEIMTPHVRQQLPNAYAHLLTKIGILKTLSKPVADNAPPMPGKDPMQNAAPAPVPVPHDGMVARYVFNAVFTIGGPARVEIVMRYRKQWQIVGLHIDSPLLPN